MVLGATGVASRMAIAWATVRRLETSGSDIGRASSFKGKPTVQAPWAFDDRFVSRVSRGAYFLFFATWSFAAV